MLKKPKKVIQKVEKVKVVKPAFYKQVETGELREVKIIDENGVKRTEERPVTKKEFVPPVTETIFEEKVVWEVKNTENGEIHKFVTKEDADRFYRGV